MNSLQPLTNSTQAEQVLQRLHHDIISCKLAPGTKLSIVECSKAYGIGATPLREALSRLAATGLVIAEGNRGFRVGSLSVDDLVDLTKTRMLIEDIALRASIINGDLRWESEIVACAHRLGISALNTDKSLYLDGSWEELHFQFHAALVSACGANNLLNYWESLFFAATRYRRWNSVNPSLGRNVEDENRAEDEHRAIMDAVLSRNADKAVKLMHSHMIKLVHTNLTTDPDTKKDADDIVAGLWSDIEASRPGNGRDEAASKPTDGAKHHKPKHERGYIV